MAVSLLQGDPYRGASAPQPVVVRPRGLPVPPIPVMPPEGVAPVTDPTANVPGDELSPTTLVLNYLKQRGYTPSSENVRRALEANARDPGVIPGLRSDTASEDTGGGGGGGKRTSAFPQPVNLSMQNTLPPLPGQTSAQPTMDTANTATTAADQTARFNLSTPEVPRAPPQAGVPVVPEVPRSPIDVALDRATTPELPAPPVRPAIAGPPDVPAVAGPEPRIALPAPPRQITGPPQANEAPVALPGEAIPLPDQSPQGQPGGRVRVGNVTPRTSTTLRGPGTPDPAKIAPGPQIRGAPIQPGPVMGPVGRIVTGGISGAGTGGRIAGTPGAVAGGVAGAAPGAKELADYILSGRLHLY